MHEFVVQCKAPGTFSSLPFKQTLGKVEEGLAGCETQVGDDSMSTEKEGIKTHLSHERRTSTRVKSPDTSQICLFTKNTGLGSWYLWGLKKALGAARKTLEVL